MKRIVLVGNQNCGKTTLFNALTGLSQRTGNWPGVTVERRAGTMRGQVGCEIADLPGAYSLNAYTEEERVTRDMLLSGEYDVIVNMLDATCLGRGLYLTYQLLQLGKPVIIALNMMDEAERRGLSIDATVLSDNLGVSVVPMAVRTGKGIRRLTEILADLPERPEKIRIAEGSALPPTPAEISDRYRRIDALLGLAIRQKGQDHHLTEQIDALMLHTPLGYPVIAGIVLGLFFLSFGPLSAFLQDRTEELVSRAGLGASVLLGQAGVTDRLRGFVTDGIIAGVGCVLSFLAPILLQLTGLSVLEDSGLMTRAVYLLDGPMRRLGLSGRAFIPLLLGFGCTVPAAMAVRSMPGSRERTVTVRLLPFMSCGAKLPVYGAFVQAFFPGTGWFMILGLYLGGVLLSMAASLFLAGRCREHTAPLMMEMPPYRLPTARNILKSLAAGAGEFLTRTFTVILLATVAVWCMQHFTFRLDWTDDAPRSILGSLAGTVAPLLTPLGFGSMEASAALLTGVMAKESILSTLTVLCGQAGATAICPTAASALSFLTFVLLYTPCVAALSAIGQTLGSKKHALRTAFCQLGTAWVASYAVYMLSGGA